MMTAFCFYSWPRSGYCIYLNAYIQEGNTHFSMVYREVACPVLEYLFTVSRLFITGYYLSVGTEFRRMKAA
jgi:hypothetical protein